MKIILLFLLFMNLQNRAMNNNKVKLMHSYIVVLYKYTFYIIKMPFKNTFSYNS